MSECACKKKLYPLSVLTIDRAYPLNAVNVLLTPSHRSPPEFQEIRTQIDLDTSPGIPELLTDPSRIGEPLPQWQYGTRTLCKSLDHVLELPLYKGWHTVDPVWKLITLPSKTRAEPQMKIISGSRIIEVQQRNILAHKGIPEVVKIGIRYKETREAKDLVKKVPLDVRRSRPWLSALHNMSKVKERVNRVIRIGQV